MPLMTRTEDFPTVTQKALDFLYTLSNTIHEHFTFTSTQLHYFINRHSARLRIKF